MSAVTARTWSSGNQYSKFMWTVVIFKRRFESLSDLALALRVAYCERLELNFWPDDFENEHRKLIQDFYILSTIFENVTFRTHENARLLLGMFYVV